MALKALMLRKKLNDKQKELEALRKISADLEKREKELETAIEEVTTEEERSAVEESVNSFEAEKEKNQREVADLESEVAELEEELRQEEEAQNTDPVETPAPAETNERKDIKENYSMKRDFFGMSIQERDAFIAREDVQKCLSEVRAAIAEKRAITNAGYLIPKVMLGLLRENIENYSKLYKYVNVRRIGGTGRMVVEGTIPEAVWTEMCANLNELNLSFSQVEVDGFKVGGYFKICNAILEDSDIDLARELLNVLGQSIGYALDKAILYGTNTKMPNGIVTALAGVTNTPNIVSHASSVTGTDLFQVLVADYAKVTTKYARGKKVWVMNPATKSLLMAQAIAVNAAGAIVAGMENSMPIVGGDIVELGFVPDNTIIAGYYDLYLLAERAGVELSTSEHAFWVADQTGFKGTARYDGEVLDTSAFVAIGINGVTPAANAVSFAEDTANASV